MSKEWEPRIVAFFCTWCTYTAADLAGISRMTYAPNARIIRVMCSGRVDPQFVLKAFADGADGVLIGGCHPGDCHYQAGNYKALRSCSHLGGVPGLANLWDRQAIFDYVYKEAPSVTNPEGVVPQEQTKLGSNGYALTLPSFRDSVRTLDQTVEVDYYLPGCPPPVKLIANAVTAILENKLPPKGTVLAPDKALCEECPRKPTKPDKLALKELKRPHQTLIDPEKCLLAQGLLCLGPATRSGCGAPCVSANMPCTGCLGPTSRVKDYGAKALSAIAP
jgi:F420-non-reducing hydrogenase small subunit